MARSSPPGKRAVPNPCELAPVTVGRLLRVHDLCVELQEEGRRLVLSNEIAERVGGSAAQVRKDLSKIGELGTRGCGYRLDGLASALELFLRRNVPRDVVLVGAGSLCSVLLGKATTGRQGLRFSAVFDTDPDMVGARCRGNVVRGIDEMREVLGDLRAEVAVLAVPAEDAQHVTELLVQHGIRAILNLTPVDLSAGREVVIRKVDLNVELENLLFRASYETPAGGPGVADSA